MGLTIILLAYCSWPQPIEQIWGITHLGGSCGIRIIMKNRFSELSYHSLPGHIKGCQKIPTLTRRGACLGALTDDMQDEALYNTKQIIVGHLVLYAIPIQSPAIDPTPDKCSPSRETHRPTIATVINLFHIAIL